MAGPGLAGSDLHRVHRHGLGHNTDGLLYKVISTVVAARRSRLSSINSNEVLRKTGHFLGYGILSVLVFLALKNTNRDRLRLSATPVGNLSARSAGGWSGAFIGMMATIAMATYDEIHQTLHPVAHRPLAGRRLDTCGAIAMQFVVYLLATRKLKQSVDPASQAELSSTH